MRDLTRRPGDHRDSTLDFAVPERLGESVVYVDAGAQLHIDLRLESLHEGVLASGDVETTASGQCVRCLDDLTLPVEVEFQELFAYSVDEAFDYTVQDDHVDLEPVVRDAVVLSLPFQPVCRPDCPGLDPETGERLADHPEWKPREVIDPRWAALESLRTAPDDEGTAGSSREKR
ncbi:YceD family protein [Diaminobutyricimonas aerilata]|uniref:YceD family protein n=1 Tax=Diaminobutyricimonas aerilata TaxID=1162967 RepID=UPI001FE43605|nr:DUF177 domain-containing protein [Diaminobutyricimonas aerilata]